MADDKVVPIRKPEPQPKKIGVRTVKDVTLSTRAGLIVVQAFKPVTDPHIIGHLERSGTKLEPVYED